MRFVKPFAAVLLLVCAAPVARGQSGVQPPDGYPAFGQPPRITVLGQGATPRTALRYAVARDRTDHMNMDMTQIMTMNVLGQSMQMALPTMRIGVDVTVTDVSASGDMTYRLAFTGVSMEGGAIDPAAVAAVSDDLKQVSALVTMSNRGVTKDGKIDISKLANPQLGQALDSVTNSISSMACVFPEEAIGVGGHWDVRQAISANGATMFQKVGCELTAFDGKAATLKVTMDQTAPPQPMKNPALPPEADVTLESLSGSGTGTVTAPLNSLVPTGEMNGKTVMSMGVSLGGQAQSMNVESTVKVVVAPRQP